MGRTGIEPVTLGLKVRAECPQPVAAKLNLAATGAARLCNKLQLNAGSGDKSVHSAALAIVGFTGNEGIIRHPM